MTPMTPEQIDEALALLGMAEDKPLRAGVRDMAEKLATAREALRKVQDNPFLDATVRMEASGALLKTGDA